MLKGTVNTDPTKTMISAHRGVSAKAPENTLAAFKKAMELGCEGIEFDVHLSKDKVPVIVHDETVDRTSNGTGYVKDLLLAELKELDFGAKFTAKDPDFTPPDIVALRQPITRRFDFSVFSGPTKEKKPSEKANPDTRIPTLEEFLALAKQNQYAGLINLELKNDVFRYEGMEEKVLELLDKYGFKGQALISSFNHDSIGHMRQLSPDIKVALLYDKGVVPDINDLKHVNAYSANMHFQTIDKSVAKTMADHNIRVFAYTVNDREEATRLMKLNGKGIDGIFSDNPGYLMELKKNLPKDKTLERL